LFRTTQGKNLPWAAGLATFPVVGLGFLAVTSATAPWLAAAVGGLSAIAVGVGVKFGFPVDSDLDRYNVDARRRVAKVLSSVKAIDRMAGQVKDPTARSAIEEGCSRIPDMLDFVQKRDPSSVASMAAKLNVTTSGIETSLAQYLQIQKDPDLYEGADDLIKTGQEGFANFRTFVVTTYRQLNAADVMNYKATFAALKPLEIQQLTQKGA
jgi:hypothetical protein